MTNDKKQRKETPMATGLLDYFPDALAEVANVSFVGNAQHNPGQPMHWAREKSQDHADCIIRHLAERGKFDTDGLSHSGKVVWRALANLQLEIEARCAHRTATEVKMVTANYDERRSGWFGQAECRDPDCACHQNPVIVPGMYDVTHSSRGRGYYFEVDQDQSIWKGWYSGIDRDTFEKDIQESIRTYICKGEHTMLTPEEFKRYDKTPRNNGAVAPSTVSRGPDVGSVDSSSAGGSATVGEPHVNAEAGIQAVKNGCNVIAIFDRKDAAEDCSFLIRQGCLEEVALHIVKGITRGGVDQEQGSYFYIAGPMRGIKDSNFPAFDLIRDRLLGKGATVISPADIDRAAGDGPGTVIDGQDQNPYAYRDFFALMLIKERGGYVVFLNGWEKSVGARAEYFLARWLKIMCVVPAWSEPDKYYIIRSATLVG